MTDISSWISHHAVWRPEKTAIRFAGENISYVELSRRISRAAAMLSNRLAIRAGDRIAFLGYNSPEMIILLFACARLGAMLVPLNWRLAPPEHAWILQNCTPGALFVEAEFLDHIAAIRDSGPAMETIAMSGGPGPGWLDYQDLLNNAGENFAGAPGALEDRVLLVYTSGTTGRAKGSVLDQRALLCNAINAINCQHLTPDDHALTTLPMFHVGGLNIQTTPLLHAGGTVSIHRRFDPDEMMQALIEDRPTITLAVPAISQALISHPRWNETDLSHLRLLGIGSSAVPEALVRPWLERGVAVTQIYGLTESAPVAIASPLHEAWRKPTSCGKPVIHCQARIADDQGQELPIGEKGEILLRGENLLREYWRDPETTREAFIDGWFRTGDVGHVDEEGFFYVDDRKKDVIISGGENIYPAELENILTECAEIAECAVIGLAHEKWVEIPVACVVLKEQDSLDAAAILALFEGRLARYKHPRKVVFLEQLPRNAMAKVEKFTLRDSLSHLV